MKKSIRLLSFLLCMCMVFSCTAVFAEAADYNIYVSPNGNDGGAGTKASPFKTVQRAQAAAREMMKTADGDVAVNLTEGIHFLEEPLKITDEDNGKNGNKMIWRSTEDAVVSGGLKLDGKWEQHDGNIYKISVPESFGDRYIAGLSLNGDWKTRAKADTRVRAESYYEETDANGKAVKSGFIFSDEVITSIDYCDDIELGNSWQWRYIIAPVYKKLKLEDGKVALVFRQPDFTVSMGALKFDSYGYLEFDVYNAYELMNQPGEFYYDRAQRTLYYYKGEEESLDNALTIIPNLDKVVEVCGTDSNHKVKDLIIEGITFSHTSSDERTREYIHHPHQDGNVEDMCWEDEYLYPQWVLAVRAGMWLSHADGISVRGNTFTQMMGSGIGIYDGVENSDVTGNAFFELASSAITAGLIMHEFSWAEDDGLTNISARKRVTGSEMAPAGNVRRGPQRLTHGDYSNSVWADTTVGEKWSQIDLEEAHRIKRVYLVSSGEHGFATETRQNFDILGSNTPDFANYEILARHGEDISEFPYATPGEAHRGILRKDINDPNKYRYIRIVKQGAAGLLQAVVMTDDMDGAKMTEMPHHNRVANNYMIDVCQLYRASVPLEIMYVRDFEFTHNEIYNAPYSSITIGWGWSRGICTNNNNNKLSYNYLQNAMRLLADGANIYCLDRSSGTEVFGNYLNGACGFHGGLYFDNGSAEYTAYNNVVERTCYCVSPWSAESDDISIYDNFTSTPNYRLSASDSYVKNMEVFVRNNLPAKAQEIKEFAGLEPEYEYLRAKYTSDIENMWELKERPSVEAFPVGCTSHHYDGQMIECQALFKILEQNGLAQEPQAQAFRAEYERLYEKHLNKENTVEDRIDIWYGFNQLLESFTKSGFFKDGYKTIVFNDGIPVDAENTPILKSGRVDGNIFSDHVESMRLPMLAETKVDADSGELSMSNMSVKNIYYTDAKFGDVMFEFDFLCNPRQGSGDFPGFVLRGKEGGTYMETQGNCGYSFNICDNKLDLQRFVGGKRTVLFGKVGSNRPQSGVEKVDVSMLSATELNKVKVGCFNVENGVRIYLEINGQVVIDYVDESDARIDEPGFFSFLAPFCTVKVAGTESAVRFTDLENAAWAKSYIYLLSANDIIKGRGNGIFAPSDNVTYDEWVLLLTRTFEGVTEAQLKAGLPGVPGGVLKREDAAVMLYNAMQSYGCYAKEDKEVKFGLDDISDYAKEPASYLGRIGLLSGDTEGNFNPANGITRAECAKLVFLSMQYTEE